MSVPHKLLQLQIGAAVLYRDRPHRIKHILDLNEVLVVDDETQEVSHAKIGELAATVISIEQEAKPDLVAVHDAAWDEATKRFEIIRPLLNTPSRTRQDVVARAKQYRRHENTLYSWIRNYESTGLITSLLPRARSDKGTKKLTPEIETIIQSVVDSEFLTKQRKSQQKVCNEVRRHCANAGIDPPHKNTV